MRGTLNGMRADYLWSKEPDIADWLEGVDDHLDPEESARRGVGREVATGREVSACAAGWGPRCDGSSVVTCQEGWATARSVCGGAGASCVQTSGGFHRAFCISAVACTGQNDVHCAGGGAIEGCYGGAVVAMTCDAGTECREYGTVGTGREAECVVR